MFVTMISPEEVDNLLVEKRDGKLVKFDKLKIKNAIAKAAVAAGSCQQEVFDQIVDDIAGEIFERFIEFNPNVENIQDIVEKHLMKNDLFEIAKSYIVYRAEKRRLREEELKKTSVLKKLKVKKRNNELAFFNPKKVWNGIERSATGLREIDVDLVFKEAVKNIYDGIRSEDIEKSLVLAATSFIEIDPAYNLLAARLFLQGLRKEVFGVSLNGETEEYYREQFINSVQIGVEKGIFDKRMMEFDLKQLSGHLDLTRDNLFKYMGLQTLYERYFVKVEGRCLELPQIFWMRVAMGLAINEKEKEKWAIEFYEAISQFLYIPSTPTLFHSGLVRSQLSSCFPGNTKIITSSDLKPIRKVTIDDLVLSQDGSYHKVTGVASRNQHEELVAMYLAGIMHKKVVIRPTLDHPISCISGEDVHCIRSDRRSVSCPHKQGEAPICYQTPREYKNDCLNLHKDFSEHIKWVKAGDVKVGDFLEITYPKEYNNFTYRVIDFLDNKLYVEDNGYVYKLKNDIKRKIVNELSVATNPVIANIELNYDFGLFLGYYLSEGYINGDDCTVFTFNSNEKQYIEEVDALGRKLFGVVSTIHPAGDGSTRVSLSSKIVATFINNTVGTMFNLKKLPIEMMQGNIDFTKGLIVGIFRGDGFANNGGLALQLSNEFLVYQVFLLLLKLGCLPTIKKAPRNELATEESYVIFVSYGNKTHLSLIHEIDKGLEKITTNPSKFSKDVHRFRIKNRVFYRVNKISKHKHNGKVYDIQVEDDPSFSANLVCAHNCYLNVVSDDLHDIFKTFGDNAQLSKYSGGIGTSWSSVRATGANISSTGVESQGVIPFLKIANDTTVAINRSGKRRGAACVYLATWHLDIEDFLDLRKNTGDERRRTHDMNTANWIPDLFMKRVSEDKDWTLFSPDETPDLPELYGKKFEEAYEDYEKKVKQGKIKKFKVIKAKQLWRKMLTMLFETGHPWICFSCPSNIRSPQDHCGVIHSSNLCTEVLENTSKEECAVCNLASINLVKFVKKGKIDYKTLAKTIKTIMRGLDNVIDVNYYPISEAKNSNSKHRPVGLGIMGLQDALYMLDINFEDSHDFNDELTEFVSYEAISASCELAKERGVYSTFKGSKWDRGIFPLDTLDLLEKERSAKIEIDRKSRLDWKELKDKVKEFGMRNSLVTAFAPTATISTIVGCFPTIEPIYKNIYVKSNMSGEFAVINEYLVKDLKAAGLWKRDILDQIKYCDGSIQSIDSIPKELKAKYKEAFEIDPFKLIELGAIRGKWIDQSQSLNAFVKTVSGTLLSDLYMKSWRVGLKTNYYLRTLGASSIEKATLDAAKFQLTQVRNACKINDPTCESCQ